MSIRRQSIRLMVMLCIASGGLSGIARADSLDDEVKIVLDRTGSPALRTLIETHAKGLRGDNRNTRRSAICLFHNMKAFSLLRSQCTPDEYMWPVVFWFHQWGGLELHHLPDVYADTRRWAAKPRILENREEESAIGYSQDCMIRVLFHETDTTNSHQKYGLRIVFETLSDDPPMRRNVENWKRILDRAYRDKVIDKQLDELLNDIKVAR